MFSQRVQWSRRLFVTSARGLFADFCIDLGEDLVNIGSEINSSEPHCMYHGSFQLWLFVTICDKCFLALLSVCLSERVCYLDCCLAVCLFI